MAQKVRVKVTYRRFSRTAHLQQMLHDTQRHQCQTTLVWPSLVSVVSHMQVPVAIGPLGPLMCMQSL